MLYNWSDGECPTCKKVLVDGVEIRSPMLLWVDTETGEYEEVVRDKDGTIMLTPDRDEIATRRGVFNGKVTVVW